MAFTAVVLAALIMLGAARLGQLVGAKRLATYVPAPVAVALAPKPEVVADPPPDEGDLDGIVEVLPTDPPPTPTAAPPPNKTAPPPQAPPKPPPETTPQGPPAEPPPKAADASPPQNDAPTLAAGMGQVTVTGDPGVVALVNNKGRFKPGQVPAGRYEVLVSFGGRPEVKAGAAQVGVGQVVVVTCREAFMRCSAAVR